MHHAIFQTVVDQVLKQPTTPIEHTQSRQAKHQTQRELMTLIITTQGGSYRVRDPMGEWLSTGGCSSESWTVEVADQVSMSDV
jgi:hypothetical protein